MRNLRALASIVLLVAGCTPYIPVKPAFGISALAPTGSIPPEFARFNNYDPRVNTVLADEICATPYRPEVEKSLTANPGEILAARGRCQRYDIPFPELSRLSEPTPEPPQ